MDKSTKKYIDTKFDNQEKYFETKFATKDELGQVRRDLGAQMEELKHIVQQGFEAMHIKFAQIDERFDRIEAHYNNWLSNNEDRLLKLESKAS